MTENLVLSDAFNSDGHLGEVTLTAIADGQDRIVPEAAFAHLTGCDHCTQKLGEAALLSAATANAFAKTEPKRNEVLVRPPIPWGAMMAAVVIAAIGALPRLEKAQSILAAAFAVTTRAVPALIRSLPAIIRDLGPMPMMAAFVVLLFAGAVVVRTSPPLSYGLALSRGRPEKEGAQS